MIKRLVLAAVLGLSLVGGASAQMTCTTLYGVTTCTTPTTTVTCTTLYGVTTCN